MDQLPLEIIDVILSRVSSAPDVVRASATCRTWRRAFCDHLGNISFDGCCQQLILAADSFHNPSTDEVQDVISRTIFQTTGLQCVTIDLIESFSAEALKSWLLHLSDSLRELRYQVLTFSEEHINFVEIFGERTRQKLEKLTLNGTLKGFFVTGLDPNHPRFTSLRWLSLVHVCIPETDFVHLSTACIFPMLESLELLLITSSKEASQETFQNPEARFRFPNLKRLHLDGMFPSQIERVIVEAANIEYLDLECHGWKLLKIIGGGGSLKNLTIRDANLLSIEICFGEDLETIDFENSRLSLQLLYQWIAKSSKLSKLRLWGVWFFPFRSSDIIDWETIARCCPRLNHLSLCISHKYDPKLWLADGVNVYGSARLESMISLNVGLCEDKEVYTKLVEGLLRCCPGITKLTVSGPDVRGNGHVLKQKPFVKAIYQMLWTLYNHHVDLQFKYAAI